MRKFVGFFSALGLLLSACGKLDISIVTPPPVTPAGWASQMPTALPQSGNAAPRAQESVETGASASSGSDPLGELYFSTMTVSATTGSPNLPFQWVRLPGSCVVGLAGCPEPEPIVPPFPIRQDVREISWSPDGSFAAVVHQDDVSTLYKLWFFDPAASTWTSMFEASFIDRSTSWSPDGNWIVFRTMNDQEIFELYAIQRDGAGLKMLASLSSLPDIGDQYVMDGWIAENIVVRPAYPEGETASLVYLVSLADGTVQPMPEALITKAHFTPASDGAWLAYDEYNQETMEHKLFVAQPDGANPMEIASFLTDTSWLPIVWSPDNNRLAFVQDDTGPGKGATVHVYVINRDGTGLQEVCRPRDTAGGIMFSPDGKFLLVNSMGGSSPADVRIFIVNLETLEERILEAPGMSPDMGWFNPSWRR